MESGTPVRPWPEQSTVWWSGHKQLAGQFWPRVSKVEEIRARKGFSQLMHGDIVRGALIRRRGQGVLRGGECQRGKQINRTEREGEGAVRHLVTLASFHELRCKAETSRKAMAQKKDAVFQEIM